MLRLARRLLTKKQANRLVRLVAPMLLALAMGGCMWWPDIQERQDALFGPAIDRTKIDPSPDQVVDLTTLSTQFSVAGAVSDPDTPVETLEYQWYVGYLESPVPRGPDFIGQPAIRFNPCAFQADLIPFQAPHVLELLVSDQPIEFDPEGGRIIKGGYAYVSWTFVPQVACP